MTFYVTHLLSSPPVRTVSTTLAGCESLNHTEVAAPLSFTLSTTWFLNPCPLLRLVQSGHSMQTTPSLSINGLLEQLDDTWLVRKVAKDFAGRTGPTILAIRQKRIEGQAFRWCLRCASMRSCYTISFTRTDRQLLCSKTRWLMAFWLFWLEEKISATSRLQDRCCLPLFFIFTMTLAYRRIRHNGIVPVAK